MRVVLSWLNELAPVGDDVDALAATLTDLGLAVDAVERVGTPVPGVVVARVLDLRRHPDADRVQLVDVDAGDGVPRQIGCGAFNLSVGDLVPLATVGTVLPGDVVIGRRKLRGQWSEGMLCSPRELGRGDDHAGIWILPPLDPAPLGVEVFEALGIRPDVVFDLDLTRNRPDAWSHLGVARDLAARLGVPLHEPRPQVEVKGEPEVAVALVDPERCGRFTTRAVRDVVVGPSPGWMAERLARAGMRPINNVVDISNYVMLELGQPNHPYDADLLAGGGFRVRDAADGEVVTTLDGVERTMSGADLLICDGSDRPVGIAGVMGGSTAEISETTTEVILEMAWFDPSSIAATVARTGLRSEASARFERGVDPELADRAADRFVELLRLTCPAASVTEPVDARGKLPERAVVALRTERVGALLGATLTEGEIRRLLEPMGFAVEPVGEGSQRVTVPSWRPDCTTEIDLVEEVARQRGYGASPRAVPHPDRGGALTPYQRARRQVLEVLVGLGGIEVMPTPFLAPGDLERAGLAPDGLVVANPLVAEESVLRTSLLPGLLRAVAYNAARRQLGTALFELGHVVRRPIEGADGAARLPDEREVLAVALGGADAPAAVAWCRVLAGALRFDARLEAAEAPGLHPGRSARIVSADGAAIGWVGELDPDVATAHDVAERVGWLEVDLGHLLAGAPANARYQPVSRFPSSDLDLAFVVPDAVPAAVLETALRSAGGELVADVALFDVFRGPSVGEGRRSLAYRLRLQARDHTLSDAELAAARRTLIEAGTAAGGTLR